MGSTCRARSSASVGWLGTYDVPAGCSVLFCPDVGMKDGLGVLSRNFDFPTEDIEHFIEVLSARDTIGMRYSSRRGATRDLTIMATLAGSHTHEVRTLRRPQSREFTLARRRIAAQLRCHRISRVPGPSWAPLDLLPFDGDGCVGCVL